jgi:hypothetical protein
MVACKFNLKFQLVAALIAMLSINVPAFASCKNWKQLVPGEGNGLIYAGTVGDRHTRAFFVLDELTGKMSGEIGFNDDADSLVMKGRMSQDLEGAELTAETVNGEVIADLHLTYSRWRQPWESANAFAHDSKQTCEFVVGKWVTRSSKKSYELRLQSAGTMSRKFVAQEKINEKTAVLLRSALLRDDKKGVAALLEYPFHSEFGNQLSKVWQSPEDVISHYKEVIQIPNQEVRESVPHVLQTGGAESIFVDGHIQLTDGIVTRICQEACTP